MMAQRYLQFVNIKTGERAENSGKVEVTGKREKDVEMILRGMLRNASDDWYVDDFEEETVTSVTRTPILSSRYM